MTLDQILERAIVPALELLPPRMDRLEARLMLLAIGLQESRFEYRRQVLAGGGDGPARGFWQFECGTKASKGGVWGVYLHEASRSHLAQLCARRGCEFEPRAIWSAIEHDDILAAGLARLLLWTDPKPLPAVSDVAGAWNLYAVRTWRPGKPHRQTWDAYHMAARRALEV